MMSDMGSLPEAFSEPVSAVVSGSPLAGAVASGLAESVGVFAPLLQPNTPISIAAVSNIAKTRFMMELSSRFCRFFVSVQFVFLSKL
jgi:hypothetical protein